MTQLEGIPVLQMTREQFQAHLDEQGVNTHDAARVASFFSEDGIQRRVATQQIAKGRAEIRDAMEQLFQAFSDFHLEVLDIFSAGDRMCVQSNLTGTHDGELLGIPPTQRRVEVETCAVFRIGPDGLVDEEVIYTDSAKMLRQLGLLE